MTFPPLIIWAKGPFFFEQLFSVVARTWLGLKSECLFFGPKFRFLAKKSDFCHTIPIFVDDPFLALDKDWLLIHVLQGLHLTLLSSPRAKRAGPKGPRAESARAVTGRRNSYRWEGGLSLIHI